MTKSLDNRFSYFFFNFELKVGHWITLSAIFTGLNYLRFLPNEIIGCLLLNIMEIIYYFEWLQLEVTLN